MLTLEENRWNFQTLKILSRLNLLPIQIDGETTSKSNSKSVSVQVGVQVQNQRNRFKLWTWRVFYCLGIFHWLFMFGRFLQSIYLYKCRRFRWDHFIVHFIMTVGYFLVAGFGYLLFQKHPTDVVIIINYVFSQNQTENEEKDETKNKDNEITLTSAENIENRDEKEKAEKGKSSTKVRPIFNWPISYSVQELLARTLFLLICGTGIFIVTILGMDPTRPQLLFTVIPEAYKNWIMYLILLAVEECVFAVLGSLAYICVLIQLEFLDKCEQKCQHIENRLRRFIKSADTENPHGTSRSQNQTESLHQILREMKELELCIQIFNRCFPFCIFSFKILCLSIAIFGCCFTIRQFGKFPLLSFFSGYISLVVSAVYTTTYEKAFAVPKNMERLKTLLLLAARPKTKSKHTVKNSLNLSHNQNDSVSWPEFKRQVERIRNVGIKVGSFHHMERMSTLNFIDFVLRNVVNLLVLFKR